jgi:hypothetical protein
VLVGLPGSGKTHKGKILQETFKGIFLDDVSTRQSVIDALHTDKDIIIADPHLVTSSARSNLLKLLENEKSVEFYFFENDPETCIHNVLNRKDGRVVSVRTIREFSKKYEIPVDIEPIKVYKV